MKKIHIYSITALTLLLGACSKSEVDQTAAGDKGAVRIRIETGTRAASDYNPLDHCTIRISSAEGVIRQYASQAEMPSELWLLAGTYTIQVEAGDMTPASFTNKSYRGEQEFTVAAGTKTDVEVKCKLLNAVVEVTHDASLATAFFMYGSGVCIGDTYSAEKTEAGLGLSFSENGTGYFLLPEGETALAWSFAGVTNDWAEKSANGTIADVKPGVKYQLTFRYSPDKGGIIDFTLTVDESTDDYNDTIIFDPQTGISLAGEGFEIAEPQPYLTGEIAYLLSTQGTLAGLNVRVGERTIDLLPGVAPVPGVRAAAAAAGVTVTEPEAGVYRIAFGPEFFATLPGGEHTLTFTATDSDSKTSTADAAVITQGILAPEAADYDLWANSVTLKARVLDANVASVKLALREADGTWHEADAAKVSEGIYAATFSPTWKSAQNEKGLTVYTLEAGTGVRAGYGYECKAIFDGSEQGAAATFTPAVSQPIPYGDMEDGSLSAYTTSNTAAPFWASGNNSFTKSLCTQQTFAGMGGAHCTKLAATSTLGMLAAGNFFTGTFTRDGLGGYVLFGQSYDWKARPAGLSLKYHAKVGTVNIAKHSGAGLAKNDQDISVIYVAIVDWSARHRVDSSTSGCSGMWSPDDRTATEEGAIIGYGILYLNSSTEGGSLIETTIPIHYYDQTAPRPASGKYSLVISASTSLYGDYMTGCDTNELHLDDLQWVY